MWFKLREDVPDSFLETAPWIFRSEVDVTITVDECWRVMLGDDGAYAKWHPEVQNVQWKDGPRGPGAERTVVFSDPLSNVLLVGTVRIREKFVVWEDNGDDGVRRFSFVTLSMTRPNLFTFRAVRQECRMEKTGEGTCRLTRIFACQPGFLTRYVLGPVVHRRFKHMIETKCPALFLAAYGEKKGEEGVITG